jgi:hypothetical protein
MTTPTAFQESSRTRALRVDQWGNVEDFTLPAAAAPLALSTLAGNGVFGSLIRDDGTGTPTWYTPSFGTVTQGTSNATAVTLNARAGVITMFGPIAATTKASFILNNSAAETGGLMVVTPISSGIVSVNMVYSGAGAVTLHVYNHDASPTSAAVKLHFIVMTPTTTH